MLPACSASMRCSTRPFPTINLLTVLYEYSKYLQHRPSRLLRRLIGHCAATCKHSKMRFKVDKVIKCSPALAGRCSILTRSQLSLTALISS
ncbi:hypothetical protein K438DRAFT_1844377 [Mycena galopus ATCC 62051]|nr:hypothetical protein K438DRAFT_1844377 [Mycena galopus ATCC 62051]